MKDLKRGDFVWSCGKGIGIVLGNLGDPAYEVLFEGQKDIYHCTRRSLFTKGDEVEETGGCGKGTFLGITDDNENYPLIINTIYHHRIYVTEIKHKIIDKLEVILTMNGKEIDAKAISKETWDNLRNINEKQ